MLNRAMEDLSFQFVVGDKVHHRGWKVNCFVFARSCRQDHDEAYLSYELFVIGEGKMESVANVTEYWLEVGHREDY